MYTDPCGTRVQDAGKPEVASIMYHLCNFLGHHNIALCPSGPGCIQSCGGRAKQLIDPPAADDGTVIPRDANLSVADKFLLRKALFLI